MQRVDIQGVEVAIAEAPKHSLLTQFSQQYSTSHSSSQSSPLLLEQTEQGLSLTWNSPLKSGNTPAKRVKPLHYHIDVNKWVAQLRSFPAPKQGAFNQALGKKSKYIIDATGGWGGDAMLMCLQGYEVLIIERQPIMALLLNDAMQRLEKTAWAQHNNVVVPTVINMDAIEYFTQALNGVDCVYLDPMFPPKKKKSAATNKHMQLLQWLVGEDPDARLLLQAAQNAKAPRIAVKRPDYAEPLQQPLSTQFSSKLVHYDVYLA